MSGIEDAPPGARGGGWMNARRRAVARVNLAAIERNVARLRSELPDGGRLCAVVKADGYGHGAVEAARAALAGGASWLAVAGATEAAALRAAGLAQAPLLVMGALSAPELRESLAANADVVVWRERDIEAVAAAGGGRVHVKLDTGMGRLGTRDQDEAMRVLSAAERAPRVQAIGVMTHFATADEREDGGFFDGQLKLFADFVAAARARWPHLIAHAANSAATLREPASHFDMVRCGVAIYGLDPFQRDPLDVELEPALQLVSYVAELKDCRPGESAGYGRRFVAQRDTRLAVLPIGYGDGWRRALSNDAEVLVGGVRRPLVGTISMDNLTVELGTEADDALLGAEAVLVGAQGEERITAEEIGRRLQSINYEVTCALSSRVLREHHRDGRELDAETAAPLSEADAAR